MSLDIKLSEANGGALHLGDLKPALIGAVNALLDPVRAHLSGSADVKSLSAKMKLGEPVAKK
jgi:hypothetical protein